MRQIVYVTIELAIPLDETELIGKAIEDKLQEDGWVGEDWTFISVGSIKTDRTVDENEL